MSSAQRLLAFLVILSVAAIALRAVSHRSRIPYPVVLAAGGVLVGLIPGGRPAVVGSDLILLAFVPGLVFQASISLDLDSLRRVVTPVTLLAT
ncbi:MAG: cation:proton antiporter, partial [Candidatus Dormibacteraeota bacterium]|nr:cation:proton antiporter [Candidatus Dormibacteraeota bacterium]